MDHGEARESEDVGPCRIQQGGRFRESLRQLGDHMGGPAPKPFARLTGRSMSQGSGAALPVTVGLSATKLELDSSIPVDVGGLQDRLQMSLLPPDVQRLEVLEE